MKSLETLRTSLETTISISSSDQEKDLMQRRYPLKRSKQGFERVLNRFFENSQMTLSSGLAGMLIFYKSVLSVHMGGTCRFEPSCSEYALQASRTHNFTDALKLITIRLCKCHPWGPFGIDPVPKRTN